MKMIRTLIAEDEAPARQWLRSLCARHRDLTLVGECASVSEASQKLRSTAVDLLLLDIHLGPHLGFRVLDGVPASSVPLVIVVTAHDRYAVRAFEKNAVDYLLKPVSEDRLAMALDRARRRLHAGLTSEMRAEIQAALAPLHELLLRGAETAPAPRLIAESEGVLHVLDPREIELIESDGNYVKMHTREGCYTMRSTMQAMEESLAAHLFIRLSRSVMVNTAFIARIERDADSVYEFVMRNGRNVKVGRSYRQPIAELIRTQGLLTAAAGVR
jgi:two-component system, LytTR family, response regulator